MYSTSETDLSITHIMFSLKYYVAVASALPLTPARARVCVCARVVYSFADPMDLAGLPCCLVLGPVRVGYLSATAHPAHQHTAKTMAPPSWLAMYGHATGALSPFDRQRCFLTHSPAAGQGQELVWRDHRFRRWDVGWRGLHDYHQLPFTMQRSQFINCARLRVRREAIRGGRGEGEGEAGRHYAKT